MHDQQRIAELAHKWLNGIASAAEEEELFRWWREHPEDAIEMPEGFASSEGELSHRMLRNMQQTIQRDKKSTRVVPLKKWLPYAAAAVILIIAGAAYYFSPSNSSRPADQIVQQDNDIAPGGNKAVLTLADGRKIEIDGASNGTIAEQQGVNILKSNGTVSYVAGNANTEAVIFNTMSTPRGGTYQLILPDGSKAWLNAASSIRYPVIFTGGERKVEVSGEVYFEVVKNKSMPFIVSTDDHQIEVLGTEFNVNTYEDEPYAVTTLLHGAVRVNNKILSPGESYSNGTVQRADTEKAIAWTKGITYFNKTSIAEMMRAVSRWYDIDVEYKGVDTKRTFSGEVPRSAKLSTILKLLSAIDIHYSLDPANKKIILHP